MMCSAERTNDTLHTVTVVTAWDAFAVVVVAVRQEGEATCNLELEGLCSSSSSSYVHPPHGRSPAEMVKSYVLPIVSFSLMCQPPEEAPLIFEDPASDCPPK